MVSRGTTIKLLLIVLAVLILFTPFLYPTCRIEKEQLHTSVTSPEWIGNPEGGVLTMKITIDNSAACDASIESLQLVIYRLIFPDNTTQDVDMQETQSVHTTVPAGGNVTVNIAAEWPFEPGAVPRPLAVQAKIAVIFQDGSSLEVFDRLIDTTPDNNPNS